MAPLISSPGRSIAFAFMCLGTYGVCIIPDEVPSTSDDSSLEEPTPTLPDRTNSESLVLGVSSVYTNKAIDRSSRGALPTEWSIDCGLRGDDADGIRCGFNSAFSPDSDGHTLHENLAERAPAVGLLKQGLSSEAAKVKSANQGHVIRLSRDDDSSSSTLTSPGWVAGSNGEGASGSDHYIRFTPERQKIERADDRPAAREDDAYRRGWGLSTSVTGFTDVDPAILMEGLLGREVTIAMKEESDRLGRQRANAIRGAMIREWKGYSEHAWGHDEVFLSHAKELTDRIMPAFSSPTGLPYEMVDLSSVQTGGSSDTSVLSEMGSLQVPGSFPTMIFTNTSAVDTMHPNDLHLPKTFTLEFRYLSQALNDDHYADKAMRVFDFLSTKKVCHGSFPSGLTLPQGSSLAHRLHLERSETLSTSID